MIEDFPKFLSAMKCRLSIACILLLSVQMNDQRSLKTWQFHDIDRTMNSVSLLHSIPINCRYPIYNVCLSLHLQVISTCSCSSITLMLIKILLIVLIASWLPWYAMNKIIIITTSKAYRMLDKIFSYQINKKINVLLNIFQSIIVIYMHFLK